MPIPIPSFAAPLRFGAFVTLLLLGAGCATENRSISTHVTSPAAPRIGSAPIAAYDEYALSVAPLPPKMRAEMVAQNSPN